MKTEKEINKDILKITMEIRDKYPELSKYIEELPVTIPNIAEPEINTKSLMNYYESLDVLLKKYKLEHENISK